MRTSATGREQAAAEDLTLVRLVQRGDPEAFEALVERHQHHAYAVACRMLPGPEDAQDVCQEVFLKVHRGIRSFKEDASFATWLHRIVLNACASFHRRRGAAKRGSAVSLHRLGEEGQDFQVAGTSRGPEERASGRELRRAVQEAISALGDEYREVVVMRDLEGLSYEECAEALGVPTGTIRSRLHRARKELAWLLRDLGPDGKTAGNGPAPMESKGTGRGDHRDDP